MIWKIYYTFVLCSLTAFALPQAQKTDVSSTPSITYEKDINDKVLGVLKKVYPDLANITDSRQRSDAFPRTYGMNIAGQKGFVWNMLSDARKSFDVGSPRSSRTTYIEQDNKTEKNIPEEEQADPQESEGSIYLQILSELLESDEFWDWLTGWIETYTELLDEHIKVEVEEAVTKQIKEYFDKLDYLINEEENSQYKPDIQDINSGQDGKDSKGFLSTQTISNSSVYNEYVTNIYFTDPAAEKVLIDKLAKAVVAIAGKNASENKSSN